MKAFLFCLLVLTLAASLADAKKLASIYYVGFGYDIYVGNPHSDGVDPGYRLQKIFDLSYDGTQPLLDDLWEVPNHINIARAESCKLTDSSSYISDMNKYQKSLQVDAKVFGKFPQGSFKASVNYKQVEDHMRTSTTKFVYSQAFCSVYYAENSMFTPLNSEFKLALKYILPTTYDKDSYMLFLNTYGTHYVQRIEMGAKFAYQFSLTEESVKELESKGISVDVSAKAKILSLSGGVDVNFQKNDEHTHEFETRVQSTTQLSYGLPPVQGGDAYAWAQQIITEPVPIGSKVAPISNLINRIYLKDQMFSDEDLMALKTNLDQAMKDYCSYLVETGVLQNCEDPQDPSQVQPTMMGFLPLSQI